LQTFPTQSVTKFSALSPGEQIGYSGNSPFAFISRKAYFEVTFITNPHEMNPLERLAEKLSLTRAEILTISALLAFLLLGSILRTIQSSELEAAALQRAEAAMFSDAETDSLIQLAVRDQARVAEIVKESLEETASRRNRNEDKMARKAPKKPFTGTVVFNRAGSEELQQIKGIGPVMAERLIAFRTENGGRITTFKELLKVKGVGLKKLEILKKHLSLE